MHLPGSAPGTDTCAPSGLRLARLRANREPWAGPLIDWRRLLGALAVRLQRGHSAAGASRLAPDALPAGGVAAEPAPAARNDAAVAATRRQHHLELFDLRMRRAMAASALAGRQDDLRRAQHRAGHDALTLLPNRWRLRELLPPAPLTSSAAGARRALLYIDLDDFKPVNEHHGPAVGDELLRTIARRLVRAVRAEDRVLRVGADEFACLISDQRDHAGLDNFARKLIDVIAAPVALGPLVLRMRASIGIAVSPLCAHDADGLLGHADAAMYRARRAGSGVAHFDRRRDDPGREAAEPSAPPPS